MIDGIEVLANAVTDTEDNTLLQKDERSDIDKLLDELKVLEELVTYSDQPSDPLYGQTVNATPTVNDIIGYKGNLNAIIPAGFIMLHNDLTGVNNLVETPTTTLPEEKNTTESTGILGDLSNIISGLGKESFLTGLTNLGKIAGFGVGVVGIIDNLRDAFDENGNFNWGTFVGENALPIVCGTIAGILTGSPAIGAAVYGFMSTQDWWKEAEAETMEGYNTLQAAQFDATSEEYATYHDLIEKYKKLHTSETEWMENNTYDEHVILSSGEEVTEAWADTQLVTAMNDYIAKGSESIYAFMFEAANASLEEIFKQVGTYTSDKEMDPTKKDSYRRGYYIDNDQDILTWIAALNKELAPTGQTAEEFLATYADIADLSKIDNQQLLFLYNVSRYMQNPEDFQYMNFEDLSKKASSPSETTPDIAISTEDTSMTHFTYIDDAATTVEDSVVNLVGSNTEVSDNLKEVVTATQELNTTLKTAFANAPTAINILPERKSFGDWAQMLSTD